MDYITTFPIIQNIQITRRCVDRMRDSLMSYSAENRITENRRLLSEAEDEAETAYEVGVEKFGKEVIDTLLLMRPQTRLLMSMVQALNDEDELKPEAQAVIDEYYNES